MRQAVSEAAAGKAITVASSRPYGCMINLLRFALMKRVLHLLLILVLTLWLGVAAAHVCAGELPAGPASQGQSISESASVPVDAAQSSMAGLLGGTCCGGICHELSHVIVFTPIPMVLRIGAGALNSPDLRLAQSNIAVRHERPQWADA